MTQWMIVRSYANKDDAQAARKEYTRQDIETRVYWNPRIKRYVLMAEKVARV